MIDSTETGVLETALKLIGGRVIINSVNLEDGEKRLEEVLPLCKKYGAAVIALTIDEEGMALTTDKKVAIAHRIHDLVVNKYGLRSQDLILDPLTFTLANPEYSDAGINTIEAVRIIKRELPNCYTLLGVSNCSFGMNLYARKILKPDVTVGIALSGALTPAGLGYATLVPLVEAGFVDWIVSTGANLYHDTHRSLGFELFQTTPFVDDMQLRDDKIIRIYDIVFDQEVLLESDAFLRKTLEAPEFQKRMGTAELHYYLGKYLRAREKMLGVKHRSLLGACYECGVPVYTSSPGDSTIGMNVAAMKLAGGKTEFDVEKDVNETTAIVYGAKAKGGKSAVIILGGGSPKNFVLQTEPQIQEIMGIDEKGHDYFIQITDARPDTGGLSGATPSEAVTWGKLTLSNCLTRLFVIRIQQLRFR